MGATPILRTADVTEAYSFLRENYDPNRTVEQWCWEYRDNYPELVVFAVMETDKRIVGVQPMGPIYINIKGQRMLSGRSDTSVVDPGLRRGRYWLDLYSYAISLCASKGMQFIWGNTMAGIAKKLRDNLGFSIYGNIIKESFFIRNPHNMLAKLHISRRPLIIKSILFAAVIALFLYCNIYTFVISPMLNLLSEKRMKHTVENKIRAADDINKLYSRIRGEFPNLIHIDQDEQYINWRIYNNPYLACNTYFLYKGDTLTGCCYIAINQYRSATITNLTFEQNHEGRILLIKVMADLRKLGVYDISFLGNIKNPLIDRSFLALREFGFISRSTSIFLILKNISLKEASLFEDIRNWCYDGLWREGLD